jgi:alpha-D-ribose 1-methylphosphonate 5-triphosphate diphosphatase PhnM
VLQNLGKVVEHERNPAFAASTRMDSGSVGVLSSDLLALMILQALLILQTKQEQHNPPQTLS